LTADLEVYKDISEESPLEGEQEISDQTLTLILAQNVFHCQKVFAAILNRPLPIRNLTGMIN
jgi:hypothetical protein